MQAHNLVDVFQYELCSYPSALFEKRTTPRLALCKLMPPDLPTTTGDVQYILDGGACYIVS